MSFLNRWIFLPGCLFCARAEVGPPPVQRTHQSLKMRHLQTPRDWCHRGGSVGAFDGRPGARPARGVVAALHHIPRHCAPGHRRGCGSPVRSEPFAQAVCVRALGGLSGVYAYQARRGRPATDGVHTEASTPPRLAPSEQSRSADRPRAAGSNGTSELSAPLYFQCGGGVYCASAVA